MSPSLHFAVQRTSWDDDLDQIRPGSASDLICREIQRHMPTDSYTVGREPLPGRINIYTSTRPAFHTDVADTERLSVLLGHGCADKGIWSRHAPQFDHVITPGPLHSDIVLLSGVEPSRIHELGYAKLDPIFNGEIQASSPHIIYAPTHGGGGDMDHYADTKPPKGVLAAKRSSWWRKGEVLRILHSLPVEVVECWHPRYTEGNKATLHQYVGAQAAICDGGSTLYECMILGVPVVIPAWITAAGHRVTSTLEGELYRTQVPRMAAQPRYLANVVRDAIQHGPTQAEQAMGERVLPTSMRGVSGKAQAEWLLSLA